MCLSFKNPPPTVSHVCQRDGGCQLREAPGFDADKLITRSAGIIHGQLKYRGQRQTERTLYQLVMGTPRIYSFSRGQM